MTKKKNDKKEINESETKNNSRIKRIFENIKKRTEGPREFMKAGRAGGMMMEVILTVQFGISIIKGYTYAPDILAVILTVIFFLLLAEITVLILKLIFGGAKRSKIYFIIAMSFVAINNISANQGNAVFPALLTSFALTLSADVLGRCFFAMIKTSRYKQVFAYAVSIPALLYMTAFGYFFHLDVFGESRVEFYNSIIEAFEEKREDKDIAPGFDSYLDKGEYKVSSISYGPDAEDDIVTKTLDYTAFDSVENRNPYEKYVEYVSKYDFSVTPVKGQIWYPVGRSDCPVLFFVHGNHDSGTPSYQGYDYLGEYLASNGYVVVSVDENIINDLGEGNDKRAILLLDNMKAVLAENSREGSLIYGLIDEERIAIGGHSRGGEMVAAAYLFNDYDTYPEDGNIRFDYHFNISSIVAIAPCVDQYTPVHRSVKISDVNYLLIHGSNDQDVSVMMGEKQYNNISFSKDSDKFFFKTSVYILGANHGQFNSLWGRYDMGIDSMDGFLNTCNFLDENDQKLYAKAYIRTFLDATLKNEHTYATLLSDASRYRGLLPETALITNYTDSEHEILASFDDTTDIGKGEKNVKISCSGTDTWTIDQYIRGNAGESEDSVLSCSYSEDSEPRINVSFPEIDISNGCISFRMADMREGTEELSEGLDYSVILTDASGRTVSVKTPELVFHTLAVQLYKDDVLFGSYEYKHQLCTVNVTPDMFEDPEFDFGKVTALTITTPGSENGQVIINDITYRRSGRQFR